MSPRKPFASRVTTAIQPLRARVTPALTLGRQRWLALSPRERQQVGAMVIAVVATATWLLLVKPAIESTRHWQNELPRLRSQAAALKDVLADAGYQPANPADTPRDRLRRLKESLATAGLAGAYTLHEGRADAGTQIQIEFVPSVDVAKATAWMLAAPRALRMTVSQFSLQRGDAAATPRAEVRFTVTLLTDNAQ